MLKNKIKIELQHLIGCPNSPILIKRVKKVIKNNEPFEFSEVLVDTDEKAKKLLFRGSPTLLINGKDFENEPEQKNAALACRYYPNGLPSIEDIRKRISELKKE